MADARRPFVKFETVAVEDRVMTAQTGIAHYHDVDFIVIVPHGSEGKTELREDYKFWVDKMERQVGPVRAVGADSQTPFVVESRFPREWLDEIKKGYEAWKKGEELPVKGTPLKQWGVLPPAMLQNFIANHLRTIEELADAADEAIEPAGMGARIYRNHAQEWVRLNKENNATKAAAELTALRADNARLTQSVADLTVKMGELLKRLPNTDTTAVMQQHVAKKAA